MPELPEVETIRCGLAVAMEGATFIAVDQRREDLRFRFPRNFSERITGSKLLILKRRAKYLCGYLSSGEVLVMHLGMSGRFTVDWGNNNKKDSTNQIFKLSRQNVAHDHITFFMSNGANIIYNDPRRFGFMDLVPATKLITCKHFLDIGIEPLSESFNADYLAKCASKRRVNLKIFLLDQRVIAGLGNIYACEILHRAGFSPRRQTSSLVRANGIPSVRATRLISTIQDVLTEAISAGGSTIGDYAAVDGRSGYFQNRFRVYGRKDEACTTNGCTGTIRRIVQGGRSTFFCGHCQH
ncbi:MAG: bifunctional DNA-formamidopyrimidine glycosylase/DNA-(apurinic or apyrimidinic site) lyase [Hyphomicrobiaceae bacterium]|nr:bifunctional DNA-formamidopyrimidine glycosylase/DNA-(apurinic or apyrimidinic site) lyase [Hyphomicrobiaceae bacterium]